MEFKRKKKVKPEEKPKAKSEEIKSKGFAEKYFALAQKNKITLTPISEKDRFEGNCHIARAMIKVFGRLPWMNDFIDQDGNNLPFRKGVVQ